MQPLRPVGTPAPPSFSQPPPPAPAPLLSQPPPPPLGTQPLPPAAPYGSATAPAPPAAPLQPLGSAATRRDDSVLGNIMAGKPALPNAAPAPPAPMAPLAPTAARDNQVLGNIMAGAQPSAAPAPPAPMAPLAPLAAAPASALQGAAPYGAPAPPAAATAPGGGYGLAQRPKPPPIETTLPTPRPPDAALALSQQSVAQTTQQRDNAVLAGMMQQPAAATAPQPLSSQLPGSLRRDDAVLSSFMQPQPPGQVGQRRDDAALAALAQQPPLAPATPQLGQAVGAGRDDAVLAQMMGGVPQQRHDAAVLAQVMGMPAQPAAQAVFQRSHEELRDDTALEQLLGLNSPLAPKTGLTTPMRSATREQVQPQALPRRVDFKPTPIDVRMAESTPQTANPLVSELYSRAPPDDMYMSRRPAPGSLRQRHGGSLSASTKRLSMQPRGRVPIPTPRKPRRIRVPPRQGHQRDILEDRAKNNLEEENLDLRKHQNEMKKQLQQLEVKLRRAKSPGREGADKKQREEAWADVKELKEALLMAGEQKTKRQGSPVMHRSAHTPPTPGGPRGQRQGSQRRVGSGAAIGRLRGRMTNLPWGQAMGIAPAPSASAPASMLAAADEIAPPGVLDSLDGRRSRSASPSPVPGFRPDSSYGGATPPSSAFLRPGATEPSAAADRARSRSASPAPDASPRPFSPTPSLGPLMPSSVPPLAEKAPWSASKPFGSLSSAPALPGLGATFGEDDEVSRMLRDQAEDLRASKRQLSERLDALLVSRIAEDHTAHRFRDKARHKEDKLKNLEKMLSRERQKAQETQTLLTKDTARLEQDLALARNDLHHHAALQGVQQDIAPLRQRLKERQDQNTLITKQIRDLTVGAFCTSSDNRMISQQRLDELTKQIEKKDQDCTKMVADQQAVDVQRTQAAAESAELEKQCRALMEENERLTIRMEEKSEGVRRAQEQMTGVLENLDPEDKKVLLFSLQFLREREAAKANQQLLDAVIQGGPRPITGSSAPALGGGDLSVEETTHLVDSLRAEKDDLAQEVRAIQDIVMRERGITKDLRAIHRMDMDEHALQIQVTMQDTERCKGLAAEREKRIEELQKELVRRKRLAGAAELRARGPDDLPADVVSEAGFSELSELEASNNALDICITDGRLEERALLEIPRPASGEEMPLETALVTMVLVDFLNMDVGCSGEASGLRPHFNSLISMGPFEVNDEVIEHFARGAVRFELQAFAVGATAAYTLGRASLPLAVMLDCTPQDPNPVVTGTLSFAAETDVRLQIATVQYKARLRKSALEALALFTTRCGAPSAIKAAAVDGGGGVRAAAGLMDAVRTLLVQVISVEGLISYRPGVPPQALRPYVSYEVKGHKAHSTDTMTGPSCRFEDTKSFVQRVDADFCRWADKDLAEGGGLNFIVLDNSAPVLPASSPAPGTPPAAVSSTEEQLGVLGEVMVPLGELLKSSAAQVQGSWPLRRGTGRDAQPAGVITLSIRWKDDASVVLAAPGVGGPTVVEADRRASGVLSEEQYQITWQRVIRRLHVLKLPAMDWFYKHDVDQDGFWTKQETHNALSQMPIGLSPLEIDYIFDRMDVRRRGLIAPPDLGAALAEAAKAAPLELWARDVYRRISEALARQGQLPEQAFCAVAQGWQAQKRDFFALLTSLDLGLKPDQLEWLWKLSDASSFGVLDFRDFANRLREAAGTGSTAFTIPRAAQEALQAPVAIALQGAAGAYQAPMSETGMELCMIRILKACYEMGWRTIDKIMQELGVREDGAVSRANLVTFCLRVRARLSDWEVEQIVGRFDSDGQGVMEPRALRTSLLQCDISDSSAQVAARRAVACIGRMRAGLLKRPPPSTAAASPGGPNLGVAWRALLEELATQKVPLVANRQDFVSAAVQLGIDDGQWQLDELWAFVDKMRDGSLDIDSFIVNMAATPLPGEISVDAMSDEHFAILMGRLKKALDRLGIDNVEKAFQQFRTGQDGCISPAELELALEKVVDNLSPHERKLLVGRIDSNKDGRISFVELEAAMARASVSAISSWAQDVCQRISASLQREGKSIDTLFDALAKDSPVIHWPMFETLFAKLEPSLSLRQLQHLWQAFDKNGDGGVSREEFKRAFVMVQEEGTSAAEALPPASSTTDVLLSRIYRVIGVGPLSVKTALAVYDTMADGSLDWNQWRQAVLSLRLPLSEPEAIALHRALTRNSPSGRMLLSVLEAEVTRVALQTLPEERWARAFIPGCAQRALECGAPPLDQVLAAGNEEAVEEAVFLAALSRHHPVSEEQWVRLRPLLERRPEDGRVLWKLFLRWASVPLPAAGAAQAAVMEAEVCARITESLRKQGTSIDELFNALAKGDIMHWPDYVTLFATLEPTLTVEQLQRLWQSFDKNGDGGVSREEFRRGLVSQVQAPAPTAAVPPTPSHTNVCSRIRASLRSTGTTADALFESLAKGGSVVVWQNFITLFTQMEPTLTVTELERLWKSFDKDGDGGVTREEFERGLALDIVEQPNFDAALASVPPTPAGQAVATVSVRDVCARVLAALSREGKSVDDLFVALSKGSGIVRWQDFWEFFKALEQNLTQQQLESLWQSFDKDGDGSVSRDELLQGLVLPPVVEQPSAAPAAPAGAPATPAATDVCSRVLAALQRQGTTVDQLFANLAKDGFVTFAAFYELFQTIEPSLSREQLDGLWRSFDSNSDGGVSLAEFQRGLTVPHPEAAPAAASAAAVDTAAVTGESVTARIHATLQRNGKTTDELFDDIAKGGSLIMWEGFATLFAKFEPSLTAQQLLQLWKCFDKNGDGGVSRDEFRRGLGSAPQAPAAAGKSLPESAAPGSVGAAPTSANAELVRKTLEAIAAVAAWRGGDVRAQLRVYDREGTGRLDRSAFKEAMQLYSPGISEEVLAGLWQHIGGPAADSVGIALEELAARLAAPPPQGAAAASASAVVMTPAGASVSRDALWAALRRVRSTLHARGWRPQSAFEKLAPPGSKLLPRAALIAGLTAIGCPLLDDEVNALFAAMSSAVEEGATEKELLAVFALTGDGFDEYARDLFSRVGNSLSSRFGSLVSAFDKALDVTGQGVVGRASFRDHILRYGDMNLVEAQLERCWQIAVSAGGGRTSLDFPTFKRLFEQGDTAPPQATSEFMLTLEEACSKFDQLGRTANLRKALARSGPEGRVKMELLSAVLSGVAPELSDGEVEQVCRLAPRIGGPLSPDDVHNCHELLERFESGQNDWHPIYPLNDRNLAAQVCRYISQQVVASGFRSFADFVVQASRPNSVGKSMAAPALCGHLQRWMPGPLSEENREITEVSLMRLGQMLPSGGIDLEEFYARFEQLAKGGPLVLTPAGGDTGAGVGLFTGPVSTGKTGPPAESRAVSQGKACPVDIRVVSAQRQAEMAALLGEKAPTGEIAFDKLHGILEKSKVAVPIRQQRHLKDWLAPLGDLCKWPMLFAFAVGVDRVTVAADKFTREAYPFLQLEISFCGEAVTFPAFGWSFSLMHLDSKRMTKTLHYEARFNIDGPSRISQEDLAVALRPQPPSSHRVRITLYGTDSEEAGSYTYTLGVAELCLHGDVPAKDLRQGTPGSERVIDWDLKGLRSKSKPHLHATLSLTTRNAGRLKLQFGMPGSSGR